MVDCRVVWDREGQVSEIHVIARGERPAKMIARDIQTLLLVNHDLTVPYQKVSIVNLGRPSRRAGRARAPQAPDWALEAEEPAPETSRPGAAGPEAPPGTATSLTQTATATRPAPSLPWNLEGVQLRLQEGQVEVTVQLVSDTGDRVQGRSAGPATRQGMAVSGARAVLEALAGRWEPCRWITVDWVDLAGPFTSQAVVVAVTRTLPGQPSQARWAMGAAPAQGDTAVAGALAALEALGKLSS